MKVDKSKVKEYIGLDLSKFWILVMEKGATMEEMERLRRSLCYTGFQGLIIRDGIIKEIKEEKRNG